MFYTEQMALDDGWEGEYAKYFAAFMNACNARVVVATGMDIRCWPDWDWAAAFESGGSVDDVVVEFLETIWED